MVVLVADFLQLDFIQGSRHFLPVPRDKGNRIPFVHQLQGRADLFLPQLGQLLTY